jgi:hypothetical protein
MGEAKRKAKEWTQLFPDLPARVAISRPGARPASTLKYEQGLAAGFVTASGKPMLCFNYNCNTELHGVPAVYMFVQTEKTAPAVSMGVCEHCANYNNDHLRMLVREQFGRHYGLDQQPPANSAKSEVILENVTNFVIDEVPICMASRDGITAVAVFLDLLEDGKLLEFKTLRRGVSNCHGTVNALYHDLQDAGCLHLFAFKRGSSELMRSEHDPNGLHSWLEVNGWVIDGSNGTDNPVLIMPTDVYYDQFQMSDVHNIES